MSRSRRMSELLAVCVTLVLLLVMGGVAAAPLLQASRVSDKTEANRKLLRQLIARTTTEASLRRDNEDLVASGSVRQSFCSKAKPQASPAPTCRNS